MSSSPSRVDRETTCGLGPWRPSFLQRLASKKVYMFFYGALGVVQGMFFTYLSATLSTLERQFGIKSKEAAYMMSGNEISQILFAFAMPVMIRLRRRPLWTSVGLICSAVGCYLMAVPHLMAGEYEESTSSAAADAKNGANGTLPSRPTLDNSGLCGSEEHPNSLEGGCDASGHRQVDVAGLVLIFLGIVLTGVGNCVFYTFGLAYLDDNTSHENSPIMLGITYTFRLLGPTLGFLLGTFCLTTYVYPRVDPGFSEGDPRWIGAWWLGYPIIGTLILLFAGPLACFPQRLPKHGTDAHIREKENAKAALAVGESSGDGDGDRADGEEEKPSFRKAFVRLLRNRLFMYNFFSGLFYVFAFMGFGTFMPKYIEYQFRKKGSTSSSYAGTVGTISKALGLLVSGFVISKFKPSARCISGYNVVLGFFYFTFLIVFSFMGCPTSRVYGGEVVEGGGGGDIDISAPCNLECGCPQARLQPICSKDGVTNFYSPCQAGCVTKALIEEEEEEKPSSKLGGRKKSRPKYTYGECSCAVEAWRRMNTSLSTEWVRKDHLRSWEHPSEEDVARVAQRLAGNPVQGAVDGWCPVDCESVFRVFVACMFVLMVLGSTGRIGNVLVALRSIEVRDKSLSMAFNVVFLSLFAMLPAPMVYGALIDSTCVLWQQECGETTNCLLYDTVSLRRTLMLTTAFIMLVGVAFDVGVWYHSKNLVIFNPEQKKNKEEAKKAGSKGEGREEEMMPMNSKGNHNSDGALTGDDLDGDLARAGQKFASNVSLSKADLFKNGVALGTS